MCEVYTKKVILGELKSGGHMELTIWLRTQYDEKLHIIGLELPTGSERANWKYPRTITRLMVEKIKELAKENPCVLTHLFFQSDDPSRIRLNSRLFNQAGYKISEEFPDVYRVTEIENPQE